MRQLLRRQSEGVRMQGAQLAGADLQQRPAGEGRSARHQSEERPARRRQPDRRQSVAADDRGRPADADPAGGASLRNADLRGADFQLCHADAGRCVLRQSDGGQSPAGQSLARRAGRRDDPRDGARGGHGRHHWPPGRGPDASARRGESAAKAKRRHHQQPGHMEPDRRQNRAARRKPSP